MQRPDAGSVAKLGAGQDSRGRSRKEASPPMEFFLLVLTIVLSIALSLGLGVGLLSLLLRLIQTHHLG